MTVQSIGSISRKSIRVYDEPTHAKCERPCDNEDEEIERLDMIAILNESGNDSLFKLLDEIFSLFTEAKID
jgi:hypothetical protein